MQCNRIGIKFFIFCLTFLFGFIITDWLNADEIKRKEIKRSVISFDPKEMKSNSTEPQCKEYFDFAEYAKLVKERTETITLFNSHKNSSRIQKQYGEKVEILNRKIKHLMRVKEQIFKQRKSNAVHNLLYIENCVEY